MQKIEIYKTENRARNAAKSDYANILNCKPESLRLKIYSGYGAPNSCKCVCGETLCLEFTLKDASFAQKETLLSYFEANGCNRNYWYGVCPNCGV